jgi:hypothetical protein
MRKLHILGTQRSGSTYLFKTIASQVNRKFTNELDEAFHLVKEGKFNHFSQDQIIKNAKYMLNRWCLPNQSGIAKNHTPHLNKMVEFGLLELFKSADPYTILIFRKNVVDSALSAARAYTTGEFYEYHKKVPVYIETELLKRELERSAGFLIDIVENPWNIRYDEIVYYEDLDGRPEVDITQLNVYNKEDFHTEPSVFADLQRAPDKKESIVNYNELRNVALDFYSNLNHPMFKFNRDTNEINPNWKL